MLKFSKKELLNEISGTANERFQSIALYTYYILLNGASKTAESLKHQHGRTDALDARQKKSTSSTFLQQWRTPPVHPATVAAERIERELMNREFFLVVPIASTGV